MSEENFLRRFINLNHHHLCIRNHHLFHGHVREFENALEDFFLRGFKDTVLSSFFDQHLHLFLSDIGPFGKWFFAKRSEHDGGAEGEDFDKDGGDFRKGVNRSCRPESYGFRMHQGNGLGYEFTKDHGKIGDDDDNDPDGNGFRSERNGLDGNRLKGRFDDLDGRCATDRRGKDATRW